MSNVFANGLEISGKAVNARTIAVFPDTCFTPPENPATPPGVPVPYPSFGFASDTEQGTGTVKIGGKTVNIKNKSDLSKTSGTEAGSAAKKGLISSNNTGEEHFNSWSGDVKFDGEPVIRMSDLATNNHGSPSNTVSWPHIAGMSSGDRDCSDILNDLEIYVHEYRDRKDYCEKKTSSNDDTYQQSDHILQNACFVPLGNRTSRQGIDTVQDYYYRDAPCICLKDATTAGTEHGEKTAAQNKWSADQAKTGRAPTYKEVREGNLEAMKKAKPELANKEGEPEHPAIDCLRQICDAYFLPLMDDETGDKTACRTPGQDFSAPNTTVPVQG